MPSFHRTGAERFWSRCAPSAVMLESVGVVMTVITVLVAITAAGIPLYGALRSSATNQLRVIGICLAYRNDAWAPTKPTSIEPSIDSTAVRSGIKHQMLRNIPCRFDVGHTTQ